MKTLMIDNGPIMGVANKDDDAVALRLADTLVRLPQLLPPRCVREIDGFGSTHTKRLRDREQLVMSEAAIAALGQFSRPLCEQQDQLGRLCGWFEPGRGKLEALLRSLAWARMQGLRSVLLAQLQREADVRNGQPISPDVKLPVGGGWGGDAELELVPLDPEDEDPEDGGKSGGGSSGAAPAVVVAPPLPDPVRPGADVDDDDDDDDVLGFLNRDR